MEYPSLDKPKAGATRFNTDSSQLEIYDGNQWTGVMSGYTPEQQTGGTRGVVFAGESPSKNTNISYVNLTTTGNSADFGDLTKSCGEAKACASRTRGVVQLSGDNPNTILTLEYVTISYLGNSIDFGDLNVAWWMRATAGSATRGIFAGGLYPGSTMKDDIDYITISTTGNGLDFGNLTEAKNAAGGLASPTRMVIGGGQSPGSNPNTTNTIEYITIASTGNGSDFGDLSVIGKEVVAVSNATRGIFGPRKSNPAVVNSIDYITIATLGNAIDFGDDSSAARGGAMSMSSPTRGAWAGGYTPSLTNSIEYVQMMTTGNGYDFGDLSYNQQYGGGCSNGHGGL